MIRPRLWLIYVGESVQKWCEHQVGSTYAFSKNAENFQMQIPRESDKKFYITIFGSEKNLPNKKVMSISNLGIQPSYVPTYDFRVKNF